MPVLPEATPTPLAQGAEAAQQAPATPQEAHISPQFAALAKRERAIQQRAQQLKQREEQFLKQQDEYKTNYIPKSQLKDNFLGLAAEAGLTNDQIIDMVLNGPKQGDPNISALEKKLAALEAQQQADKKAAEENQSKQYQQAVKQIHNEATLLVDSDERFETIKAMDAVDGVVALIEERFKDNGTIMRVEDAAKEVEAYLLSEALKYTGLNKVQKTLAEKAAEAAKQQSPQQTQQPHQTKTLTNAAATTPSGRMTAKEKRERAIRIFNGEQL